jgi:hypothetical protein
MTNHAGYYGGFVLMESNALTKRVQRRTHKKRRINKKWRKRYGYKDVPDDGKIVKFGNVLIGTPKTIRKIIEAAKREGTYHERDFI